MSVGACADTPAEPPQPASTSGPDTTAARTRPHRVGIAIPLPHLTVSQRRIRTPPPAWAEHTLRGQTQPPAGRSTPLPDSCPDELARFVRAVPRSSALQDVPHPAVYVGDGLRGDAIAATAAGAARHLAGPLDRLAALHLDPYEVTGAHPAQLAEVGLGGSARAHRRTVEGDHHVTGPHPSPVLECFDDDPHRDRAAGAAPGGEFRVVPVRARARSRSIEQDRTRADRHVRCAGINGQLAICAGVAECARGAAPVPRRGERRDHAEVVVNASLGSGLGLWAAAAVCAWRLWPSAGGGR